MRSARSMLKWSVGTTLLAFSLNVFAGSSAPDISGVWSRSPTDAPSQDAALPGGDPPLKQRYLKAYKASRKREAQAGSSASGPLEKCWVEGVPTVMAARRPLEILQTPGQVTVLAEYMTQTRRIFMDEKMPAAEEVNPGYSGYSIGKWNGATLEVETIGIRDDIRYRDIPHSAKMKILEKIRLTGPDQLQDEMTIVDPDTLTQSYRLTFNYKKEPQHRVTEYACSHNGAEAARLESAGAKGGAQTGKAQPKSK